MLDTVLRVPTSVSRWPTSSVESTQHGHHRYSNSRPSRSVSESYATLAGDPSDDVVKAKVASAANITETRLAYPEYREYTNRLATFNESSRADGRVRETALAGFFLNGRTLKCFTCGVTTPLDTIYRSTSDITAEHLGRAPQCAYAKAEQLRQLMRSSSSERLQTFTGRWTRSAPNGDQLAKAGFYIDPHGDGIPECAFCRIKISSWPPNEHPFDTHGHASPFCRFVVNPPADAIGYDICGTGSYGQAIPGALTHSAPKYPNLASPDARMATFDTWRGPVTKGALVEAGLFALKRGDSTMCYHCGIGLERWQETDLPWEEHARQSPNCELVRLRRRQRAEGTQEPQSSEEHSSPTGARRGQIQIESHRIPVNAGVGHSEPPSILTGADQAHLISPMHEAEIRPRSLATRRPIGANKSIGTPSSPEAPNAESLTCRVCLVRQREIVILPCSHFVTCASCAAALTHCPMCRTRIEQLFRPHLD